MSADIGRAIADAMPPLSHLECKTCGSRREIGDVAGKFRHGWPTCCGHTMYLFTVREAAAVSGEAEAGK